MSTDVLPKLYTPEEFLSAPDRKLCELVDGRLVERHIGAWASYVGGRLVVRLMNHCERTRAGWVFAGGVTYCCFPSRPLLVRKPSGTFIRFGRFPGEQLPQGHVTIAPDLAVDLVSPWALGYEISERVEDYLGAGVHLVWVIDPSVRTVLIYRADGSIAGVRSGGELSGEDIIPGFSCPVDELFRTPESTNGA